MLTLCRFSEHSVELSDFRLNPNEHLLLQNTFQMYEVLSSKSSSRDCIESSVWSAPEYRGKVSRTLINTQYLHVLANTPLTMSSRELPNARRRSRSPADHSPYKRSRSPHSHRHHHHHHHHASSKRPKRPTPACLPFQASTLSKHAFEVYKPMFALYLDIQKQLILEELSEEEVRGRWKSFLGKWYG